MHILLTYPHALGIPGGGTYAFLQTARHLKATGVDVTVVFLISGGLKLLFRKPVPSSKTGEAEAKALQDIGIHTIGVSVNQITYALDSFSMRTAVANYLKQNKADAIISWHHEAAFLPKICKSYNIPFICRASGNYKLIANNPRGRIWSAITTRLIRKAITKADAVWTPSAFTRSEIIDIFDLDSQIVKVISEGLNPIFLKANRRYDETQPITRFLYFGLWNESKGIFDALEAFGQVSAKGKHTWQFHVAGWGNEKKVNQTIRKYNLADRVKLLGKLTHPMLIKALEWSQVVILPSKIESFGLAVAESQASGVPVIAYKSGAVSEIIKNGRTGWLVPLNRVDLLTEAILEAMNDPTQTFCMGMAGRDNIENHYSWPNTADQMLNEVKRLTNS